VSVVNYYINKLNAITCIKIKSRVADRRPIERCINWSNIYSIVFIINLHLHKSHSKRGDGLMLRSESSIATIF